MRIDIFGMVGSETVFRYDAKASTIYIDQGSAVHDYESEAGENMAEYGFKNRHHTVRRNKNP